MADDKRTQYPPPPGPIYFFGFIGAVIYFIQQASGFWPIVLAVLKAIVWPAILIYELLKFLKLQ